jgi:hypothetical protein
VNFPESGEYLPAVVLISGLFLGRFVALGKPVLFVVLQQLFQRWGWWGADLKETLGTGVQGGAEAEVPLVLRFEAVDVLQFIA